MAKRKSNAEGAKSKGATVGYDVQLWQMADALPPKLISCEPRVKDAEKFIGRVA